jgi:DHA1 family multidrug resistance protein-like MFS transporter
MPARTTANGKRPQAFVTQWWQLAVLRFLMGMALAGLLPSIAKVIRQSVPEQALGKTLGYLQSSQYAGQVLGPLLGGALGGLVGMRSVFFLTSGLLLAGAGLNCLAKRQPAASGPEDGADARRAAATVF